MGTTINSSKRLLKLATGLTIGGVLATVRGTDKGLETYLPEFMASVDATTVGGAIMGDGAMHDHIIDKTINMFDASAVTLTAAEMTALEKQARDVADAAGVDYEIVLGGLKKTALVAKKTTSQ